MRAVVLQGTTAKPEVRDVETPIPGPGEVRVRMNAAFLAPFMLDLFQPEGGFITPQRPFVPGMDGVGIVDQIGDGVRFPKAGDRVFVDVYYEGLNTGKTAERAFLGNFAIGAMGEALLRIWSNGTFAEYIVIPAECAVKISDDVSASDGALTRLGWLGTAYAAAQAAGVRPGEIWAVNGATGVLGASTVALGLSLGASKVYAFGRRQEALDELAALDPRVVALRNPEECNDPIDVALTAMEGDDPSSLATIMGKLSFNGRLVVMSNAPLVLPLQMDMLVYSNQSVMGSLWYDRTKHLPDLLRMIASGVLNLDPFTPHEVSLSSFDRALDITVSRPSGLKHVVLKCRE